MDDDAFLAEVSGRLAGLPGVLAVALGGSRAVGTHRADSDWDFAVYYRGRFDPDDLRALGWPGEVSEIGGWGGGVFNGGAWLTALGRRVDVHYRDLDDVLLHLERARSGRFHVEHLLFHLAGIPSYLVVAELGVNRVVSGELPKPEYPEALRLSAGRRWAHDARLTLGYARLAYAEKGNVAQCFGAVAAATVQAAHAIAAIDRRWVTNEKTLVSQAGLAGVDDLLLAATPDRLPELVDRAAEMLGAAVRRRWPADG